jgi:hypothetical protein
VAKERIQEHVVVGGGGYGGSLPAILLAHAGYKVTLVERNNSIFQGASRAALRFHASGKEYGLNLDTAYDCVRATMYFKQMLPADVFTSAPAANFYIAQGTSDAGRLTAEQYEEQHEKIRQKYQEYLRDNGFDAKEFFGDPDDLSRKLAPQEYSHLQGIAAGYQSKETGIDPVAMATFLNDALERTGVDVLTGQKITEVNLRGDGYLIETKKGKKSSSIPADQFVNATWESAYGLNVSRASKSVNNNPVNIAPPESAGASNGVVPEGVDNKPLHVYYRAMLMVNMKPVFEKYRDNPDMLQKLRTPAFVLEGEHGGMYSPINDEVACIYLPSEKGAYVDNKVLTPESPHVPAEWADGANQRLLNETQRTHAIIDTLAEGPFPWLVDAEPMQIMAHPTLSYDNGDVTKRRDAGVTSDAPGYITSTPTKAVYSCLAAIKVLQKTLQHSVRMEKMSLEEAVGILGCDIYADDIPMKVQLSFDAIVKQKRAEAEAAEAVAKAKAMAEEMGFPTNAAPQKRPSLSQPLPILSRSSSKEFEVSMPNEASPTTRGIKQLEKQAEGGDALAQLKLARCYHHGRGVVPDEQAAAKWYKLATEQGNAQAASGGTPTISWAQRVSRIANLAEDEQKELRSHPPVAQEQPSDVWKVEMTEDSLKLTLAPLHLRKNGGIVTPEFLNDLRADGFLILENPKENTVEIKCPGNAASLLLQEFNSLKACFSAMENAKELARTK